MAPKRCTRCVDHDRRRCDYSTVDQSCHYCRNAGQQCSLSDNSTNDLDANDLDASDPQSDSDFQAPVFGIKYLSDYLASTTTCVTPPPPSPQHQFDDAWNEIVYGDDKLALSVDVGTINSAASFRQIPKDFLLSTQRSLGIKQVIVNGGSHEIPTIIACSKDNNGSVNVIHSLKEIRNCKVPGSMVFRLLKLGIIVDEDIGSFGDRYRRMIHSIQHRSQAMLDALREQGNLPEDVNTRSDLFQHTLTYIWRTIKQNLMSNSGMDEDLIDWVLKYKTRLVVATPALWPDRLNYQFLDMLKKAGFTHPMLRSEPKLVAALHAFEQEYKQNTGNVGSTALSRQQEPPEDKRRIILVDIGGGTTDITTLILIVRPPKMEFLSLAVGDDNLSGSNRLNFLFREELRHLLGPHLEVCAAKQGCSREEWLDMFEGTFEEVKRDFDVDQQCATRFEPKRLRRLPTPDQPLMDLAFESESLLLSAVAMERIFDRYNGELIELIQAQLNRLPPLSVKSEPPGDEMESRSNQEQSCKNQPTPIRDIIMLDGGGSRIPYLQKRIRSHFRDHIVRTDETQTSHRSSVADGGVIAAIHPEVGTRVRCRGGYGIVHTMPYLNNLKWHDGRYGETEKADTPDYMKFSSGRKIHNCYSPILCHGEEVGPGCKYGYEGLLDIEDDCYDDIVIYAEIHHVNDRQFAQERGWVVNKPDTAAANVVATVGMSLKKDELNIRWRKGRKTTIHYRVVPRFDGVIAKWYMIVPKSGSFDKPGFVGDMWYTEDCFVAEAIMPEAGIRQEHEPEVKDE